MQHEHCLISEAIGLRGMGRVKPQVPLPCQRPLMAGWMAFNGQLAVQEKCLLPSDMFFVNMSATSFSPSGFLSPQILQPFKGQTPPWIGSSLGEGLSSIEKC